MPEKNYASFAEPQSNDVTLPEGKKNYASFGDKYEIKQELTESQKAQIDLSVPELPFWKPGKSGPELNDKSFGFIPSTTNLYALYGTAVGTTYDFLPPTKYLVKENREAFNNLTYEDKKSALLWDSVGLGLTLGGGQVVKGGLALAKGGSKLGLKLGVKAYQKLAVKVKPIEDILEWKAKNYRTEVTSRLMRNRNVSEIEADAIADALEGDTRSLLEIVEEKGQNISSGFFKSINLKKGKMSLGRGRAPIIKIGVESRTKRAYSPETIRSNLLLKEFKFQVNDIVRTRAVGKYEAAFKTQAERFYGKEVAGNMTLKTATDEQLVAFAKNIILDDIAKGRLSGLLNTSGLAPFKPVRYVLGRGEKIFKTYSKIYEPIREAWGRGNLYTLEKSKLLQEMFVQKGLMSKELKGGETVYKNTKIFTKEFMDKANEVMIQTDDIMQAALNGSKTLEGAEAKQLIVNARAKIQALEVAQHPVVKATIRTTHDFLDRLYMERSLWKIGDNFEKVGSLTSIGRKKVDAILRSSADRLNRIFSTEAGVGLSNKVELLKKELSEIRKIYQEDSELGIKWYYKDMDSIVSQLDDRFTYGVSKENPKGWLDYMENYRPRKTANQTNLVDELFAGNGPGTQSYLKMRTEIEAQRFQMDYGDMILNRIRGQSKEMFVDNTFKAVNNYAKSLPSSYQEYTKLYMGRLLGVPTSTDAAMARFLQATVGTLERAVGKPGIWDAQRFIQVSRVMNDLVYMAMLGFKPFSAIRDSFQPLIMVPADIGQHGFKALGKGYFNLLNPKTSSKTRSYLQEIGAIAEFVQEFEHQGKLFLNKKSIGGVPLSMDSLREASMFMFKRADRYNRYIAGASAMSHWDDSLKVFGKEGYAKTLAKGDTKTLNKFYRESGINKRSDWMKDKIHTYVEAGRIEEAKAMFVKDVVHDTQFLYGHLDSPMFLADKGAVGKNALIFQSWWMNYGTQMAKMLSTGTGTDKTVRMTNWLVAGVAGDTIMQSVWDKSVTRSTVLFGPFPDPTEGLPIPATLKPFIDASITMYKVGGLATGADVEIGDVKKSALRTLRTTAKTYTPGGLQIDQLIRRTKKEGIVGIPKALIKYKKGD